jgi:hypothetical protein
MLHILKTHANYNDPTWSVIISLGIFMAGVCYIVYYLLDMALKE